jgi:hypothetical protein
MLGPEPGRQKETESVGDAVEEGTGHPPHLGGVLKLLKMNRKFRERSGEVQVDRPSITFGTASMP